MQSLIRHVALTAIALTLVGFSFGNGVSQARDASQGANGAAHFDAMVQDCQRHMATMEQMMSTPGMQRMMETPAMGRMMGAPGMERMMDTPASDQMMGGMGR